MTSKLDRRFSALVEVCGAKYVQEYSEIVVFCIISNYSAHITGYSSDLIQDIYEIEQVYMGVHIKGCVVCVGPGLWINGDRGAATCHVDTHGVFFDGVWVVQAMPLQ